MPSNAFFSPPYHNHSQNNQSYPWIYFTVDHIKTPDIDQIQQIIFKWEAAQSVRTGTCRFTNPHVRLQLLATNLDLHCRCPAVLGLFVGGGGGRQGAPLEELEELLEGVVMRAHY